MKRNRQFWENILGRAWTNHLQEILRSDYMDKLMDFLEVEYSLNKISPSNKKEVFNSFKVCPWEDIKVVIIGSDPAFNRSSNGLAFGTNETNIYQNRSSMEIRRSIEKDYGLIVDFDFTLESWGKQGVLLLNSSLTARVNERNSHQRPWNQFVSTIIKEINDYKPGTIFCFWGEDYQNLASLINVRYHDILTAIHPNCSSNIQEHWNCDHFKLINKLLYDKYGEEITW